MENALYKYLFIIIIIYWLDFEILIVSALSNLAIAVKFLPERKR